MNQVILCASVAANNFNGHFLMIRRRLLKIYIISVFVHHVENFLSSIEFNDKCLLAPKINSNEMMTQCWNQGKGGRNNSDADIYQAKVSGIDPITDGFTAP